jgi:Mn-containing catalase
VPEHYREIGAVFNGRHPETGEELYVAEEIHPEGAPAHDLPPQPAVFAPGPEPGEVKEIAAKLRDQAGLPKKLTGEVANE